VKKRFGQHFLTDRSILNRIIEFADINPQIPVLEIGPGQGSLTIELARRASRVIAIEIDRDLISSLRSSMPPNVEIVEGDALEVTWPAEPFQIVANLPYNVATLLFKRFIECRDRIRGVTVMVQKEVAQRLAGKPSSHDYGPLSVMVQHYATPKYGFTVPRGAFKPRPKVDSAVVRLDWNPEAPDARAFTDFVQKAFASRRKKLANNLMAIFGSLGRDEILQRLAKAGIADNARPEELSVAQFWRVYNQF
jgi:16S rRNA (adenine1518-N6/adenine1519-N6)-dimethyltransferase